MSENGGRWGAWLNGRTGRIPNKIIAGVGVGGFGVAVYYATKKVPVLPPIIGNDENGGGGGGGEAVDGLSKVQESGLDGVVKFLSDPTVQVAGVALLAAAATLFALRSMRGSAAHA